MIKTAEEWNKAFFEERMFYLDRQPKTAAPCEPSYRRVMEHTVVSNESPPRIYYVEDGDVYYKSMSEVKKTDITDSFTEVDVYSLYYKAFPLEEEEREAY